MCICIFWINICSSFSYTSVTLFCKCSVHTVLNENYDHKAQVLFLLCSQRNVFLLSRYEIWRYPWDFQSSSPNYFTISFVIFAAEITVSEVERNLGSSV